jgi:ubiquinone/menaquinone biosynthesis C-methylase UbiE
MNTTTDIYRRLLADPANGYGFGDHWRPVWPTIQASAPHSLLDVGCGRGGLVSIAKLVGIEARGCDLAPCEPWIDQAELPVLPYANEQFDVVGCFDVLEHLAEYQIGAAIEELRRVCRKLLVVSVAECSDVRDVPGIGPTELHLTRRPVDWWREQFGGAPVWPVFDQPHWRHYLAVAP